MEGSEEEFMEKAEEKTCGRNYEGFFRRNGSAFSSDDYFMFESSLALLLSYNRLGLRTSLPIN